MRFGRQGRVVGLYWILLLGTALPVFAAAALLLQHESERMELRALSLVEDRARALAQSVQVSVDAGRNELLRELEGLPSDALLDTLKDWERRRPLVRHVFVWRRRGGLLYPARETGASPEGQRFAERYEALFTGRVPWREAEEHAGIALGRGNVMRQAAAGRSGRTLQSGWIPWFTENKLDMLGWVRREEDDLVYGVELEFMALLSALIVDLPSLEDEAAAFALLDGNGNVVHRMGAGFEWEDRSPDAQVPLSPILPHWSVGGFLPVSETSPGTAGSILVLGGILLAIFLAALLFGGILLTGEVRRSAKEALQKTSFVSNVSHELKTPLTSIRMYAELMSENRIKDEQKTKRYLDVIVAESHRLTRLVNNVLDFSRLEQGKKTYRIETLDLKAVVSAVLESQRPRIEEKEMKLEMGKPDGEEEILVLADRDSLEQALLNVVDNALKYAADGRELHVAMERAAKAWEIRLMDRGPGIPREHAERIFEKFHRVDDSITAGQRGSGLGLAIARQLLRDMGGDLRYMERDGGGTVFILSLPRAEEENAL